VLKDGNGSGTVTSTPSGIDCGDDCTELYDAGTVVTLTATADIGSFVGWSGACTDEECIVTVDEAKTVTATFASHTIHTIYLPIISTPPLPTGSDLTVEAVNVTANTLEVVIRNEGTETVADGFWVDLYINPTIAPTGINQSWQSNGGEGLLWGVSASLSPGEQLILDMSSPYYYHSGSNFSGTIVANSTVYAQVDSVGSSWFGNVEELNEGNNISEPLVTTAPSTPSAILSPLVFLEVLLDIRP